ncbi:hypothetical protein MKQ70_03930 [Chitinophaga sedimenti]|uniref:hypothetical protein n=1 Tax=Chitinophaga sedimenti TaxID=2033606 RepID=UPI00200403F8|nr:hypothetical protein [Chitinophaga sedimenti]MCK7554203.1 hypothetical protein [Chitinophaga sedimenti]
MKKICVLFSLIALLALSSCSKDGGAAKPDLNNAELVVTAKGDVAGTVSNTVIGPAGGTAVSADGHLSITVPAGALTQATTVGIQPISNNAPLGLGQGYRLTPEGTTFAQPVTLTFRYDAGTTNPDFLWITTQNADGSRSALTKSEVNKNNNTVAGKTNHFSDWAVGRFIDLSIQPAATTLKVNQSLGLEVTGFLREEDPEEIMPLQKISGDVIPLAIEKGLLAATETFTNFNVKSWSLNGTAAPVSNSNGKLTGSGSKAKYTAPGKRPTPATVAVTAQLETTYKLGGSANYLLTTNITIVESDYYLLVKVDGETYIYYQWGINGSVPPDPNDLQMVNCGRGLYGETAIAAGYYTNANMTNGFILSIRDVSKGFRQLKCRNADPSSVEEAAFTPATKPFTNYYDQRNYKNDACWTTPSCSLLQYTILDSPGDGNGDLRGSFFGTIYEDTPAAEQACQTPKEHRVSGEFRVKRVN